MASKQHVLGLVDAGRKIRRPPLVGMQFLHEGPVRAGDFLGARSGLNAKELIGLLLRHFPDTRRSRPVPRSRIALRVLTPGGLPAVKISCQ